MNWLKTIGWGLYLTCSWTWCIGMFLPVILIHRFGWLGFVLFTIPNIIGCTAFGYVIRTPERSKALVEKYKTAMTLFAIVTVAFHVFFIAMIALVYFNDYSFLISLWIPFCILAIGAGLAFLPTKAWPILATLLWVFSIIVGITFLPFSPLPAGEFPWQDAVWLLPITTFGFLLSPYLDPTFHRALQCSPSKHSFGVFGISFLVMLGVTFAYQGNILWTLSTLLGLHLILQSIFTIGAHIREGIRIEPSKRKIIVFVVLTLFASFFAVVAIHRFGGVSPPGNWLPSWQDDYIRYFVFYGLIFPAVVAIFMFTGRKFTPIRVTFFIFTALFSLPLLEAGYLRGQPWLTVLPVVVFSVWAFAGRNTVTHS